MTGAVLAAGREISGEAIEFRPSTRAFLFKSGTGWLLIAVTVATAGMAAFATLPFLALRYLSNITTRFALEGDRLHMRQGIFMRNEEEIELYRVKDIRASFSIIQQFFGNGDLAILSSDSTGSSHGRRTSFTIANVEQAREIREELRLRVEAARRQHGVREYDVG